MKIFYYSVILFLLYFKSSDSLSNILNNVEEKYIIISQPDLPSNYRETLPYSINSINAFSKLRHIVTYNKNVEYDIVYESIEFGLRRSPPPLKAQTTKHVIVAGDSNTFGTGVEPQYTLSHLLSSQRSYSNGYNFGIRGGGPHHTLALMEFFPWENSIKESEGIFIYNYYDFLLERVIGSKDYIKWSQGITPYYKINNEDVAIYQGNFNSRLLTKFFVFVNSSKFLNDLLPVLPRPSQEHTILLTKIFLKMHNIYKHKFPKGKFFVAINPNFWDYVPERLENLAAELKKNNIPYFIVPKIERKKSYFFKDYHLNILGHKTEADLIQRTIPI